MVNKGTSPMPSAVCSVQYVRRRAGELAKNVVSPGFDSGTAVGSIGGMIAMPQQIGSVTYLSVEEAVKAMGCTDGWVRMLCREGKLEGAIRFGQRAWLIPEASAKAARADLTSRSTGQRAKKSAAPAPRKRGK